ncbi:MAG: VOC family protein [Actinobacteria bacterium]|nr:VOC family protein [Actinomycetota bacterium]
MSDLVRGIDHVYYWTGDMDRAVAFYRDVLGLELTRREDDNWAEFKAGAIRFALHGSMEGHPFTPGGATASFEVDDLDAAVTAVESKGVTVGHRGEVGAEARYAILTDPDGNSVQLIHYAG